MIEQMSDREFQLLSFLIETKDMSLAQMEIVDRWLAGDIEAAPNWQGAGGIKTAIRWLDGRPDRKGVS